MLIKMYLKKDFCKRWIKVTKTIHLGILAIYGLDKMHSTNNELASSIFVTLFSIVQLCLVTQHFLVGHKYEVTEVVLIKNPTRNLLALVKWPALC